MKAPDSSGWSGASLDPFVKSFLLLFMLLNPFLLIVYLVDLVQELDFRLFSRILYRAAWISSGVFVIVALLGEFIFQKLLQVQFASFQIFGGVVFLLIGIQFVFKGPDALKNLRGKPEHIAGAIAMPIMIGPATVSASILAGQLMTPLLAISAILLAVVLVVLIMLGLKWVHDIVRTRNEPLVERYFEITGRIVALIVGTYSIEMIMQGLSNWLDILS
ncbi:MAG TPA: MarC family protein [Desulfuromonadales bacterium]|nr:MarC family protein [Desulfuromonadales bacterium]